METDNSNKEGTAEGNGREVVNHSGDHLPDQSREMGRQEDSADAEAAEKLVPLSIDDSKINSNKDASEVKFITADSLNGDAKIDIENVKIAFAGMGKEELMRFANDPFWIRMRWFLFIFFWLLWIAMLAGAIAIIVMAPKCAAPAPLKWWEQSPVYQVYVKSFKDGSEPQDDIGDLTGLHSKLDYIESLGVKGVSISSVLRSSDERDDTVEDFQDVDPKYGTLDDLKALLKSMKEKGLHLLMSLVPNHSSKSHPWFDRSERRENPYTDYYVWAPSPGLDNAGERLPPNNWLSVYNGSAWEWSDVRNEYYLHQFDRNQPDLNWRSEDVIREFQDIFHFWLGLGVSGFILDKTEFLLEDPGLQDESIAAATGTVHVEYGFFSHHKTTNLPEVVEVLAKLKSAMGSEGVLSVSGNIPTHVLVTYYGESNSSIVDIPQTFRVFGTLQPEYTASDLHSRIHNFMAQLPNGTRPIWKLGDLNTERVASRFSPAHVDGLNMVSLLLPGTPLTYQGEELGLSNSQRAPIPWGNSSDSPTSQEEAPESHLKVYREVSRARESPSIMYGTFNMAVINGSVFAYTRIKSGNPGYLVAFNVDDTEKWVDFTPMHNVSSELTVLARSTNYNSEEVQVKNKISSEAVHMPPLGALVLTFVPKKE